MIRYGSASIVEETLVVVLGILYIEIADNPALILNLAQESLQNTTHAHGRQKAAIRILIYC